MARSLIQSRMARRRKQFAKLGDMAPRLALAFDFGRSASDEYYQVFPFRRSLPFILISGAMFVCFSIPLFTIAQSISANDGELFSLVAVAFSLFWMLGWSVGVAVLGFVFLLLSTGRETLRVRDSKLILRLGIPGIALGVTYNGSLLRQFRLAAADEEVGASWRGAHLAFDCAGTTVRFGSAVSAEQGRAVIMRLQKLFPTHADAPPDFPDVTNEGVAIATSIISPARIAAATIQKPKHNIGSLSSLALIAANLVPLFGVLLLDWQVGDLMLLFWAESAVIGFFTLLKMARVGRWSVLFFGPFFTGHYGAFMAGHLLFIYGFFITGPDSTDIFLGDVLQDFIVMAPALLAFFLSHGISYYSNFLGRGEYLATDIRTQMGAPYKRIIIMHVTIIIGGMLTLALGSSLPALLLLILLKLIADLRAHLREHGSHEQSAETAS